jgi:hypothetical protein
MSRGISITQQLHYSRTPCIGVCRAWSCTSTAHTRERMKVENQNRSSIIELDRWFTVYHIELHRNRWTVWILLHTDMKRLLDGFQNSLFGTHLYSLNERANAIYIAICYIQEQGFGLHVFVNECHAIKHKLWKTIVNFRFVIRYNKNM